MNLTDMFVKSALLLNSNQNFKIRKYKFTVLQNSYTNQRCIFFFTAAQCKLKPLNSSSIKQSSFTLAKQDISIFSNFPKSCSLCTPGNISLTGFDKMVQGPKSMRTLMGELYISQYNNLYLFQSLFLYMFSLRFSMIAFISNFKCWFTL